MTLRNRTAWIYRSRLWMLVAVSMAVAVGLILADDYGSSYDESTQARYGDQTLTAYLTLTAPEDWRSVPEYNGPFYAAAAQGATKLGELVGSRWRPDDIRHFVSFLSLPIAAMSIYFIANRWTTSTAALIAAMLFATQPLVFGHTFINQKDMPFAAFFAMSIALGLRMPDRIDPAGIWMSGDSARLTWPEARKIVVSQISSTSWQVRVLLMALIVLATILVVELLVVQEVLLPRLLDLVRASYDQRAWGPINSLFAMVAEQSSDLPVEAYTSKGAALYDNVRRPAAVLAFLPAAVLVAAIMMPILRMIRPRQLLTATLMAGVAVGLASSIRIAGPLAGVLVSGLAMYRSRKRSIVPLVLYWLIAGAVTYATWPYLWGGNVIRLWENFQVIQDFGTSSAVLFQGTVGEGNGLPRYYLPYIFGVQLTIPAILLGILGALMAIRQSIRNPASAAEKFMAAAWLIIPLALAVLSAPAFYDNGRQYLFILPPVFLFAALGVDALLSKIRLSGARIAVTALVLLSGILSIIRLHPYEYVYYNSLVGGVRGAYRQYELDYWATSYQQAVETVNQVAPLNSSVFLHGTWYSFRFARPDLARYDPPENEFDLQQVGFLVVSTRANADLQFLQGTERIDSVMVDGVPIAHILKPIESD